MPYTVLIKDSARRELRALHKKQRDPISSRIQSLANDPRPAGAVALQGKRFGGLYRIRSGDFRVIYQVQDKQLIVLVVKVGDRKDVYA